MSNSPSDPGVGSPVREPFVRALMSAADSQDSWPPSPPGRSEPRMLLRQRESQDNENNARVPGASPALEGRPTGCWARASGHSLLCRTCWHSPGPISQRSLPWMSGLPGMGSSYDVNLMWWEALESSRSKNGSQLCPLQLCGLRCQFPYL